MAGEGEALAEPRSQYTVSARITPATKRSAPDALKRKLRRQIRLLTTSGNSSK
jgi:hypothetical protein